MKFVGIAVFLGALVIIRTGGLNPASADPNDGKRYYYNCQEMRAVETGVVRRGDRGYYEHLDQDGDGIACETDDRF